MKRELKYSFIISGIYLLFGVLWILLSDHFLRLMVRGIDEFQKLQSVKGVVFVSVSSVLIFSLVLFYYKKYLKSQGKYEEVNNNDDRIFKNFPIGIALIDLTDKIIKVNKSLSGILGYSENELLRLTRFDLTLASEYEADDKLRDDAIENPDKIYYSNKKLRTKSGEMLWCRISFILMHNADQKPTYFVLSVQDIDHEIKINKKIKVLNRELIEAQKIGSFGHWSYNLSTNELNCSGQMIEILELSETLPLAPQILGLLDPEIRSGLNLTSERLAATDQKLDTVVKINLIGSRIKYLSVQVESIVDSRNGELILKGTIKDVSELICLQEDRKTFNQNLLNWAFMLSHELRRPISSILGLSDIIHGGMVEKEEVDKVVSYLKNSAIELDTQTRKLSDELHSMHQLFR